LIQISYELEGPKVIRENTVTVRPLTGRDLNMLGSGLRRVFPLPVADEFDELLKQMIYRADRHGRGFEPARVRLQPARPRGGAFPPINRPPYLAHLLPFRVEIGLLLALASVLAVTVAPLG
jgi:hypothetical protein